MMAKALDKDCEAFAAAIYAAEAASWSSATAWAGLRQFQKDRYRGIAAILAAEGYGRLPVKEHAE